MSTICIPTPVDSAIDRMLALDRHFELNLWPAHSIANRRHDIGLMADHGDLAGLVTELLDPANTVLFEYEIPCDGSGQPLLHGEVNWPLIERARVARGRLLVKRRGNDAAYRDQLQLNWSTAANYQREAGDACAAGDGGIFHLGQGHRRQLIVTQAGPRFAFANFADEGACRTHVFLLPQFAESGLPFHVGQRLTAVVLAVPSKGLQARAIRRA